MQPTRSSRTSSAGFVLRALPWVLLLTGCSGSVDDAAEAVGDVAQAAQAAVAVSPGIDAGAQHSLVLRADGSVWAFGANAQGQLGDGTTADRLTPVQVQGPGTMIGVAAGDSHSLAAGADGSVWAWGANPYGQLGDGSTTQRSAPVQVPGLTQAVAVASGAHHALALRSDGSVWAWGRNNAGQLGDGTNLGRTSPVAVSGLGSVVAIAAGDYHSLAVRADGSVWAWGQNGSGQLGVGTTSSRTVPVQVVGIGGVVEVAAGGNHSLALGADGSVWAWGHNGFGQLGDGTSTQRLTPAQVPQLAGVAAIAAGRSHSMALGADGSVWAWGWNASGQIGDGSLVNRALPTQVVAAGGAAAIGAGVAHSLVMNDDGAVSGWGRGTSGQLGNNAQTNQSTPASTTPTWTCAPGSSVSCYSGPEGSEGIGDCHAGTRTCNAEGTAYGPCVGEVLPAVESCLTARDEDCDGVANEEGEGCLCMPGATASCYSGPAGTAGVGACKAGAESCNAQGTGWGPCVGEVTPSAETCTPVDDDCDGAINEGGVGCQNGGSCSNGGAGYACACPTGFTGQSCEINIDNCSPNPCQNGGACVDGVNSYSCQCVGGYTGATCATPPPVCTPDFATWSTTRNYATALSADRRTATPTTYHNWVQSSVCKSSGKWYVEMTKVVNGSQFTDYWTMGVASSSATSFTSGIYSNDSTDIWYSGGGVYKFASNTVLTTSAGAVSLNQVLGIALDMDSRQITFRTSTATSGPYALPGSASAYCIHFGYGHYHSFRLNAGQEAFQYPVPAGFTPGLYGTPNAVCK